MTRTPKSPCAFCVVFRGVRKGSAFCSNECWISWYLQVGTWKLPGMPRAAPDLKPGDTIRTRFDVWVMT